MQVYEPWDEARATAVLQAHAGDEGATLPILHALQARFGHVPAEAIPLIAAFLNLSRAEIHGVVSFYHEFRRHPPGRHILRLCRAEACQAVGGDAVAEHARSRLGVDWHHTSPDGAVTLEPTYCLGLCALGPAALLDGQPLGQLDPAGLDAALEAAQ